MLQPSKALGFLSEDLFLQGNIDCGDKIVINGEIHGTVTSQGEVMVGQQGRIRGDLQGQQVTVAGTLTGQLSVRRQLEIAATGDIQGEIWVRPGSVVVRCHHLAETPEA
jgi:cytoskeletal protein CcmA (bactofilin family)